MAVILKSKEKKEEEDGQERGDGQAGKKRNKSLASKAYEITECPLISRAWLIFRKCKIDFISLLENLKLLLTVTMTRAWKGAFPGIDTKKSSDVRVNIMSETRRSDSCRICSLCQALR